MNCQAAGAGIHPGAAREVHQLFTTSAIIVLFPAVAFATFDSRHQLPQLTLIPVAAISGVSIVPQVADSVFTEFTQATSPAFTL